MIVGSASSPFVYKVRPGSTTAEKFIDVSDEPAGTFFFGMLADAASNTLWTLPVDAGGGRNSGAQAHSVAWLRPDDRHGEVSLEPAGRR
ncbi:MAG: hypothetical protein WDM87_16835 [Terracidiphilus sp.]